MRLFENIYAAVCFATLKPTHRLRGWAGHSFLALSDGFLELETSRLLSKQQEKAIPVYYTHTHVYTCKSYIFRDWWCFSGFLSVRSSFHLSTRLFVFVSRIGSPTPRSNIVELPIQLHTSQFFYEIFLLKMQMPT